MKKLLAAIFFSFAIAVLAQSPTSPSTQPQKPAVSAQEPASGIDGDRREAMDLFEEGKTTQALALFERVVAANPDDMVATERLAICIAGKSSETTDPEQRKALRLRARQLFLRAKELGDNSNLLQVMLEILPENGETKAFSSHAEADAAMRAGEAAFGRNDFKGAVEGYTRALLIDPNLYAAALFLGDTYFKQKLYGSAGEWFKRAVAIDPNQETAYRYWGDMLMASGDMPGAREKFENAIVASPYSKRSWIGLTQWAQRQGLVLKQPSIRPQVAVGNGKQTDQDGKPNIQITLDASSFGNGKSKDDPSGSAWLMYGMSRALWRGDKFKQEFPNEKEYRHTLREEVDALHLAAAAVGEKKGKKAKSLPPDIAKLVELDSKGLLEPYVLISAADDDVAKDYAGYREKNWQKLVQYLHEYVTAEPDKKN